jgi:hypothetical protein
MANNAPATFNVGRDGQAQIVWNGTTLQLPNLTSISFTPNFASVKSTPLNNAPLERKLPQGHSIKISFDRTDATIEKVAAAAEAGFWASGTSAGGTSPTNSLFLYITEVSGAQTVRNYMNCAFALSNSGSFTVESAIKMEIDGFASQMVVM